ncbi:2-amino-4-hydroxy-6-hydroxymethyldihydropteridine diphosphokinase [Helicobacter typhlonius]|uniref:2-amino-4-hydroxy-6- hydroxymethyldihydropteridine diphosphokinase n=1 Tax=Helicobacter typhlonius TaxID=76936 RepID=UPI002FE0EA0B
MEEKEAMASEHTHKCIFSSLGDRRTSESAKSMCGDADKANKYVGCVNNRRGGDRISHRSACIISSKHYPYTTVRFYNASSTHHKQWRNEFILSLGSNMPKNKCDSIAILELLFIRFNANKRIEILATSPIWRNPPFGFKAQNDFYNAIMICGSNMGLGEVYRLIFYSERYFGRGRKRTFKNAPRTLDVDLVCFNSLRVKLPRLQIPHSGYFARPSIMLPLSFIKRLQ